MLELIHILSIATPALAQQRAAMKPAWSVQLPYVYGPEIAEDNNYLFVQSSTHLICIDKGKKTVKWLVKREDGISPSELRLTVALNTCVSVGRKSASGEFIEFRETGTGQAKGKLEFPGFTVQGYRLVGPYLLTCIRTNNAQSTKVGVIDLRTKPNFSEQIPSSIVEALPEGPISFGGELFWIRHLNKQDEAKARTVAFERDDISWKALGKKYVQEKVILVPGNQIALVITGGELLPRNPEVEPSDRDVRYLISAITIKDEIRQRLWTLEYVRNEILSPPVTQFSNPIFIGSTAYFYGYRSPVKEPWILKPTPELQVFRAGKRILALKTASKPGALTEVLYVAKDNSFKRIAYLPVIPPDKESGEPFYPYWTESGFLTISRKGDTTVGTWYALPK